MRMYGCVWVEGRVLVCVWANEINWQAHPVHVCVCVWCVCACVCAFVCVLIVLG